MSYNYKVGGGIGTFLKKCVLLWFGITGGSKFEVGGAHAETGEAAGKNGLTNGAGEAHEQQEHFSWSNGNG